MGELFDLQAGGLLPSDVDPVAVAEEIPRRYEALWSELTREDIVAPAEQRYRIAERLHRLNELGFDVDEVELIDAGEGGNKLRMRTRVAEPGHHRRLLFTRTGLEAQENQARRLLNDIASYRSYLERTSGGRVPRAVAANKWLSEVYDPVVDAIPPELPIAWTRWRSSTRSWSTAGSSPSAPAATSGRPRPGRTISPACCRRCPTT